MDLHLTARQRALRERARVWGAAGQPQQRVSARARQAPLARREAVQAQSRADPVEPRRQPGLAAKAREGPMRSEEHLLGDLLGLGPVAEHPESDPEDPMLVGSHELLEGLGVPGSKPVEERWRVTRAVLTHG